MSAETGQELEQRQPPGGELENARLAGGLAEGNGVIDPARWQMLAAIAETVYATAFVPKGLRDSRSSTLACLLYGDALGLQPMTSLKEIHVIEGVPGLSAAAMAALVRKAHPGHRLIRTEIRDPENGSFVGVTIKGIRGDTEETDEYTFTLAMATRAGLMGKNNWKSYPEAMCTARASSQICTFLFPDVFMGSPLMPEELEGLERDEPVGNAETGSPIVPTPKPGEGTQPGDKEHVELRTDVCPIHGIERTELLVARGRFYCPECKLAGAEGEPPVPDPDRAAEVIGETLDHAPGKVPATEQVEWEVANADTGESVTYIDVDDRRIIAASESKLIRFPDVEGKWEIVGYEVDGGSGKEKLLVRPEAAAAGKPATGSPEAVVRENIPEILGKWVANAQQAGNIEFVRGVLGAEREGKNRARLVGALEEIVATMEADELKKTMEGDGTGADNPLLDEPESAEDVPLEGEHEEPESAEDAPLVAEDGEVDEPGFQPFEPEPEPTPEPVAELGEVAGRAGDLEIPYRSLSKPAKIIRLAALCALVEDQFPKQRAWHLSGVVGAASRSFGGPIHALEDMTDEQLEMIWKSAEQHVPDAVQFLALAQPADVAKMGGAA